MSRTAQQLKLGVTRLDAVFQTMFGLRDMTGTQLAKYCLWFSVIGSVVITSLTPVSTASLSLWLALLLWFLHLLFACATIVAVTALGVILGLKMPWPSVIGVVALPLFMAPFSLFIDTWLGDEPGLPGTARELGQTLWNELIDIAPPSVGLAILVCVFAHRAADLARRHRASGQALGPEPALKQVLPAVPHRLGDDLIRIEAQDHYVKLVTAEGHATLKLSFSRCVDALKAFHGTQCHRSHWVRFKHVQSLRPLGSAYECQLVDGTRIPVSRRRYSVLKRRL